VPEKANARMFTPGRIGGIELKNRLVRSATYENAATEQGEVTDGLVRFYRTLAEGGVGLIVTGIAAVMANYRAPHRSMLIDEDRLVPELARIAGAVHDVGNHCKIMLQLHHPGRQILSAEDRIRLLPYMPPVLQKMIRQAIQASPEAAKPQTPTPQIEDPEPVAPSARLDTMFNRTPRALRIEEIEEIIEAHAQAIRRAHEAGFDGVQLHAAHGWLLSSFLSPHTNQRQDDYGGSTENRVRMVREICERGKHLAGEDFPVLIKMNTTDFFPDGTDLEEAGRVSELLTNAGFDAIETSGGMWETVTRDKRDLGWSPYLLPESRIGIAKEDQEAYFLSGAKAVKASTHLPVILVGGIRSKQKIEAVLGSGAVDFVSMSRPFIRQPDLPNLWYSGKGPDRSECISCNACIMGGEEATHCRQAKD